MAENKVSVETVIAYEAGFEAGYEKGVRDMWGKMDMCHFNEILCDVKCIFNNCPIAEKLLKAVGK